MPQAAKKGGPKLQPVYINGSTPSIDREKVQTDGWQPTDEEERIQRTMSQMPQQNKAKGDDFVSPSPELEAGSYLLEKRIKNLKLRWAYYWLLESFTTNLIQFRDI